MGKYVILERDGVLNVRMDKPVTSRQQFLLLPFVEEFFWTLQAQGMKAIVLANEDPVYHGGMSREELNAIHEILFAHIGEAGRGCLEVELLTESQVKGEVCFPAPAALQTLAQKYQFKRSETFYIGSRIEALRAGWAAGCQTAFVRTGKPYRTVRALSHSPKQPGVVGRDLLDAIMKIQRINSQTPAFQLAHFN